MERQLVLVLSLIPVALFTSLQKETEEFCISELFNISCSPNEMILMSAATFGRMRSSRCIKLDYGFVGCTKDITSYLDTKCSGKQRCEFPVAQLLNPFNPCPVDLTSYLETSHVCATVPPKYCPREGKVVLQDQSGYIPVPNSMSTSSSGSPACPWKVVVSQPQRLQFSLLLFSSIDDQSATYGCGMSFMFEEGSQSKEETLCTPEGREVHLYTSHTNSVTFYMQIKDQLPTTRNYAVYYQATGCQPLKIPAKSYLVMNGDTATVKCNNTQETWFLSCNNRKWQGQLGNCSDASGDPGSSEAGLVSNSQRSLPYGLVSAVIIGVLLGVCIGAIPLGFIYVCYRRKWAKSEEVFASERTYQFGSKTELDDDHAIYRDIGPMSPRNVIPTHDYRTGYSMCPQAVCQMGHHHLHQHVPITGKEECVRTPLAVPDGARHCCIAAKRDHIYERTGSGKNPAELPGDLVVNGRDSDNRDKSVKNMCRIPDEKKLTNI